MSKIIDLETFEEVKPVENKEGGDPADKKEEETDDGAEEDEEQDEESDASPEAKNEDDGAEEKDSEEKEEDGAGEGEDEGDDESEGDEKKEDEQEGAVEINDFIAENYKEKYGIENEEQLIEVLDRLDTVLDQNEDLKKELEKAKAEPKSAFKNERQQKIAEIVERWDDIQEGFQTTGTIMSMDIEKADKKAVLQEDFIYKHPELTRDQARRKFDKEYTRKYVVDADKFDSEEAAKEAKEDAEIDLASDYAKAKKSLLKTQEELLKKPDPAESAAPPKENPEVTKSIERYAGEFEKVFERFDTGTTQLTFEVDGDTKNRFSVKLDKAQREQVKIAVEGWLKTPAIYDEKGRIKGGDDLADRIAQASFALYGKEIVAQAIQHAGNVTQIKKAEEIAKRKPDRKGSPAGGGDVKNMNADTQWELLAKQKKAQRERRRVA